MLESKTRSDSPVVEEELVLTVGFQGHLLCWLHPKGVF